MDSHMMWMRLPDQTWLGSAAAFVGMWTLMMVPMMLPALAPVLWRWRRASGALVALGYYAVWALAGLAVFPLGVLLHEATMRLPALAAMAPLASGAIVLLVGLAQFTRWKARHLACCRELARDAAPWRQGLRLGRHCVACCGGLMAVLLVVGLMDLVAMIVVTAAITVERFAGQRAAHAVGVVTVLAGAVIVAQAAWLS
jgi:predicted metal-binding membrane protein